MAGGKGSRLFPLTLATNKHLLPVYDKPMIYYPLSTLMLAGIREILIITNPEHVNFFSKLFGDGTDYGLEIIYLAQQNPGGIPQGITIAKKFIGDEDFALILGDNVFYGVGLGTSLQNNEKVQGAKIYCYHVAQPEKFGIAEVIQNKIISMIEKPNNPKSNLAITGLYFFNNIAKTLVQDLTPSDRGELEIVDLLNIFLEKKQLEFEILPRGTAWLDTGSPEGLLEASEFVSIIEKRQGTKVASIEEIAWRNGWINDKALIKIASFYPSNSQKSYLLNMIKTHN